jgi:hypothetical protein
MCEYCWGKEYVLVATGINGDTIQVQCPKCQPERNLPSDKVKDELLKRFKRHNGKKH